MMVVMAAAAMMVVIGLLENEDESFRARVDSEWYGWGYRKGACSPQ